MLTESVGGTELMCTDCVFAIAVAPSKATLFVSLIDATASGEAREFIAANGSSGAVALP